MFEQREVEIVAAAGAAACQVSFACGHSPGFAADVDCSIVRELSEGRVSDVHVPENSNPLINHGRGHNEGNGGASRRTRLGEVRGPEHRKSTPVCPGANLRSGRRAVEFNSRSGGVGDGHRRAEIGRGEDSGLDTRSNFVASSSWRGKRKGKLPVLAGNTCIGANINGPGKGLGAGNEVQVVRGVGSCGVRVNIGLNESGSANVVPAFNKGSQGEGQDVVVGSGNRHDVACPVSQVEGEAIWHGQLWREG